MLTEPHYYIMIGRCYYAGETEDCAIRVSIYFSDALMLHDRPEAEEIAKSFGGDLYELQSFKIE